MQLYCAERAGVDTIVATPHLYPAEDTVDAFLERREKAYEKLGWSAIYGIDDMCRDADRWQTNNPNGYES